MTATKPVAVRIDGHSGWSVDLTTRDRGVDLFRTDEGSSYRLQPNRTTRMVALDVGTATPLVMAIEPRDGRTLRQLLDVAADDVAASTHVR